MGNLSCPLQPGKHQARQSRKYLAEDAADGLRVVREITALLLCKVLSDT
ncbi:hypothetical protein [Pseudomonas syringae]|nr:hypothetical protein [Pseudomonas syringae]